MKNYWGYRISTDCRDFFMHELHNGRLRQGWGFDEGQNLLNMTVDKGASKNLRMLQVKKGDIILIPRLPRWDDVAVVEAAEDWNSGYRFEIDDELGDFGHIFPAKYLKSFNRNSDQVSGNIRSTLHNIGRFWNINHYKEDIEKLLASPQKELSRSTDLCDRFHSSILDVYKSNYERKFTDDLYDKMTQQFNAAEWEFALVEGLKEIYPEPYFKIDRVGGVTEVKHGADIIIRIPSFFPDYEYIVAIQVKDYESYVSDEVIQQINKADSYFNDENHKLIEKIVIITRADKTTNESLVNNNDNVRFIFANDLKDILRIIAERYIAKQSHSI